MCSYQQWYSVCSSYACRALYTHLHMVQQLLQRLFVQCHSVLSVTIAMADDLCDYLHKVLTHTDYYRRAVAQLHFYKQTSTV
jgi:hypothetical protein